MAGNGVNLKVFAFAILGLLAFAKVSSARSPSMKCAWDEYYDDIMDDCGPCYEICRGVVDKNVKRGTEEQCKNQCSDYLTSLKCTKYEYFDDIMHSCAPCSELCDLHEYYKTTAECSSKCKEYLPTMVKLCKPVKQYFDEKAMKCQECSDLCKFNEPNATDPACFEKCHAYVERNPPVFGKVPPGGPGSPAASIEQSSPTGLHPGVITSIAICVVGAVAALAFSVYWFRFRQKTNYAPAPSNDIETGPTAEDQHVDPRNGGQGQDLSFGMKELGPSIQVSSEAVAQQTTTDEGAADQPVDQQFGRPETDPLGPSSAASGHVQYSQS